MLPQCSHITKKRGVYYYRRRLPQPSSGELTLSLRTRSFREAEWLAARLDRAFDEVIREVKYEKPSDIQRIAHEYLRRKLDSDLQARTESPHVGVYSRSNDRGRIAEDDLEWIDGELSGARRELLERLYQHQRPLIDELAKDYSVPDEQWNALAHGILKANVTFWETVVERTRGNVAAIPAELEQTRGTTEALSTTVGHETPAGPLLSEVLPGFLSFMSDEGVWRGQTLAQNTATYEMFIQYCGDRPVTAYKRKDLAAFYDLLRALPKLYSKTATWKEMTLREIAEATGSEDHVRLSMTTVKRHFAALGRLFEYLRKREDYLGDNPAYGFEYPDKRRGRDKRSMWTDAQISRLFSTPVWSGCLSKYRRSQPGEVILKDEKYWLPLLGAFHGNRLEEFAQLQRSDVRHSEGIWYLDINDSDGKQVKNQQSKRRVPLHPELQRLGFLDYVKETSPAPKDRLFPQLKPGGSDKKLGFYFTKWFSQYRKDVGLYEPGLDYHSFRSAVATKLAAAGVTLDVRNDLLGHEGGSVDERFYQKGSPLKQLAEAIAKVSWPDLHLSAAEPPQS
jgi:integrase